MRILLVEDYKPLRESIAEGLTVSGFAVDAVDNGIDGMALATRNRYDIVLLDIMLPGKDGLSILKAIRAKQMPSFVLMITAKDTLTDKIYGLDLGAESNGQILWMVMNQAAFCFSPSVKMTPAMT